jgi:hypothetical protein
MVAPWHVARSRREHMRIRAAQLDAEQLLKVRQRDEIHARD